MAPRRSVAVPLLAAILFAACTAGAASAPSASGVPTFSATAATPSAPASSPAASPDRPSATPHGQQVPASPAASAITGEVPPDILAHVRAQLAAKVGDAAAAGASIEVAQAVTWPDGSLGCPQPGMFYTQMVVQGYQVVLAVDGTRYDYRIGAGGTPSLCESRVPHGMTPTPAP
jgi:hypothetical protein